MRGSADTVKVKEQGADMINRFEIFETPLRGLKVLQRKPIGDRRGYLERMFCAEELLPANKNIVQINHTLTSRSGTIRGLHFQHPPHAETKFVSCVEGQVFDVAVDLRRGSATFLQWHAEVLSSDNHRTLVIPEGFAHGFQALTANCKMLYFHTAAYHAAAEGGLNALDPILDIRWPDTVTELSTRDAGHPLIDKDFAGVVL
jgi:dTDP-4-dehydrorhamnose 3,5-epimerase